LTCSRTLTLSKNDIIGEERRDLERKYLHDDKFDDEKEQMTIKERR
jgi:hypothetical protein